MERNKKMVFMKVDLFLQKIKTEFPTIKWKKYRYLDHGFDHDIVILDEKIVFRTPKKNPKDLQSKLDDEISLLHYLKKRVQVGIPQYTYIFKDKSAAGYPLLAGQELTPSHFKRLSRPEKEMIAKKLASFLIALHATPISAIKKYHVRTEHARERYDELIRNTKQLLFPRLSAMEIRIIKQYFHKLKVALGRQYQNVFIYNDLIWDHILWDKKKQQINIIDFSDCAYGDPAEDFFGLLEYGLSFTKRVFALYKGKKDTYLLERAKLYYRRIPISTMIHALQGYPCTFEDGYKMFKERFNDNNS